MINKVFNWTSVFVIVAFVVGAFSVYMIYRHTTDLTLEMQRHAAQSVAQSFKQFSDFYNTEVVEKLDGVPVTFSHEYIGKENTLPLPASMMFDVTERINTSKSGMRLHIVSEYPFPWRAQTKLTTFEKDALQQFEELSRSSYSRSENFEGQESLNYAEPLRMKQICVDCHNSHPDSPRRDWKVGDIRGILVINSQSEAISYSSRLGLAYLATFIILAFIVGYSLIYWFYNKQQLAIAGLRYKSRELDFFKQALEEHAIVAIYDRNRQMIYANRQLCNISGYTHNELIGREASIFLSTEDDYDQFQYDEMWQTIESGQPWHGDIRNLNRNGEMFWVSATVVPFMNQQGEPFQFISVQTDITTRILAEQESVFAREAAEKANTAKSDFLSSMSHELRTPLNAIIGFSELLQYEEDLSQENRENIDEINSAGHHLLKLINEILDLSKIESGKMTMSIETIAVNALVSECMSLINTVAERYSVTVSTEIKGNLGIRADYLRLKQVLLNLLSNAVKYNREQGTVTLKVQRTPDMQRVRITVSDTGIGISAEDMKKLFKPFTRLSEETSVEGTGIGLTITRKMVEMMGGEINFNSELNLGSSFWIELPFEALEHDEDDGGYEPVESMAEEKPVSRNMRVLYIEDNPANIKLIEALMKRLEFVELSSADTPEKGIELAESLLPDLVLLDINLPGMSGYDVLGILRKNPDLYATPVFALTANAMPDDIAKGEMAGFDDYITQPIKVDAFYEKVLSVIGH